MPGRPGTFGKRKLSVDVEYAKWEWEYLQDHPEWSSAGMSFNNKEAHPGPMPTKRTMEKRGTEETWRTAGVNLRTHDDGKIAIRDIYIKE